MAALLKPLLTQIVVGAPYIFTPLELFSSGEQGAWYDPSDLATLYQDSAGTTPVTTDRDPVGLMLDKSGNGNHASQASSGLKPIYRTDGTLHWLDFDGFDDHLEFAIAYSLFQAGMNYSLGYDTNGASAGVLYGNNGASTPWAFIFQDASSLTVFSDLTLAEEPTVSLDVDGSAVSLTNRDAAHTAVTGKHVQVWGASGATGSIHSTAGLGIGNYNAGGLTLSGDLYGIVVSETMTADQKSGINTYLATKSGVTL